MNPSASAKVLLTGALIFALPLAAQAAPTRSDLMTPASIEVRYDDLNLSATSGVETLKRRIQGAAGRVCSYLDLRQPRRISEYRECVREASDRALAQVNLGNR